MRVGLTYDLRGDYLAQGFDAEHVAEFDSPETIQAIEGALRRQGFVTNRIGNVRQLAKRLVAGHRWDFVFNIAEGLNGIGREAQVPALLDAYGIPYTFSDPLIMALTLDKAMAKRVVRDHGIATAPFAVIETVRDVTAVDLPYPLFAKPLAEGTGKGIDAASRVRSRAELASVCRRLIARYRQPVLVESYLPAREFTVGIVGTGPWAKVVGVTEIELRDGSGSTAYSYVTKERSEELVKYRLADDEQGQQAAKTGLAAWRALRCRDGGRVDLRCDAAGVPTFLEVNPLAGLHPTHSDLPILAALAGWTYDRLLTEIVDSCLERCSVTGVLPREMRIAAAG